jgi:hypothetical protein
MENKVCPECGEKIRGRVDKKFCGDACRNSWNNKQNADANNFVRNINNSLRKNRKKASFKRFSVRIDDQYL